MTFVWGVCLSPSSKVWWFFYENLKTVDDFGKDSRKQAGIVFWSSSLLGHVTKNDNRVANIGNQLCKILETEGWLIPNLYVRSCSSNPSLSLIKIMTNVSFYVNLLVSDWFIEFSTNQKLNQYCHGWYPCVKVQFIFILYNWFVIYIVVRGVTT